MSAKLEEDYRITITNKEIWDFFNENPTIDIENAVLILIDILDITLRNSETTINNKVNARLLASMSEQVSQMKDLRTDVSNIKQDLSKFNQNLINSIVVKFSDIKKDYIGEIKNILTYNDANSMERITALVDKNF